MEKFKNTLKNLKISFIDIMDELGRPRQFLVPTDVILRFLRKIFHFPSHCYYPTPHLPSFITVNHIQYYSYTYNHKCIEIRIERSPG